MKKHFFKTLILGSLVLASCDLNETPYGFYSESNFFKTSADAEAAVMYAYGTLNYIEYSRTVFFLGDMPTESITTKSDASADNQDLDMWRVDNFARNSSLENFFKYAFIGVNRANAVIKNLTHSDIEGADRNQFLGEAYFLRAWNYFNLVRNFGLVPLHSTVVETLDQTSTPLASNLDVLYDLILSDCWQPRLICMWLLPRNMGYPCMKTWNATSRRCMTARLIMPTR